MINRRTPKVFFSSYKPPAATRPMSSQTKQLIIVALIVVGGYFLTRLPIFQIKNIETEGVDSPEIVRSLQSLKGQSILSAASEKKIQEIMDQSLEILELRCDKGIPNTLRCRAQFREPVFQWQSGKEKYLIDSAGFIYKKLPTQTTSTPLIEDREMLPVELGQQVVSEEIVTIFQQLGRELANEGIVVERFFINTSSLHPGVIATGRKDSRPFPKKSIEIRLSASYPVSIQVQLLSQLLKTKSKNITTSIDLRTPGYLYYR